MKKFMLLSASWFLMGASYALNILPSKATIDFSLSNIERGTSCPTFAQNAKVVVSYSYNFERNMGLAYLKQLQSANWTEVLHPLGLSNLYGFMSNMAPKKVHLDGGDVVVHRIIFNLHFNGDAKVLMMIGSDGDCIMSSNTVNVNS